MSLLDRKPEAPGMLLARALRERYPNNTAKHVARDVNVKPETVKGWIAMDARMPQSDTLLAMFRLYGPEFAAAVDPSAEWAQILQIDADLSQTRAALDRLSLRLEALGPRK